MSRARIIQALVLLAIFGVLAVVMLRNQSPPSRPANSSYQIKVP